MTISTRLFMQITNIYTLSAINAITGTYQLVLKTYSSITTISQLS